MRKFIFIVPLFIIGIALHAQDTLRYLRPLSSKGHTLYFTSTLFQKPYFSNPEVNFNFAPPMYFNNQIDVMFPMNVGMVAYGAPLDNNFVFNNPNPFNETVYDVKFYFNQALGDLMRAAMYTIVTSPQYGCNTFYKTH